MENNNNSLNNKDIFRPRIINPTRENSSFTELPIFNETVDIGQASYVTVKNFLQANKFMDDDRFLFRSF